MYKKLTVAIPLTLSLVVLQGCSGDSEKVDVKDGKEDTTVVEEASETKEEPVVVPEVEEPVEKVEKEVVTKEESEPEELVVVKDSLTVDEFNAIFTQDSEEEQFPNGKYELMDGSIINADTFSYGSNDVFDYADVVFFDGKLAHMQIESESSIEDIEKGIGVSFEGARIEEFKFGNGYEIIFNEKFADENIAVFPIEW